MPLRLIRAPSNRELWSTCAETFLQELGSFTGPSEPPSWLWLVHRNQRDSLLEMAAECGIRAWLAPPFSFLSELRSLFSIEARPVGILTGRLLVARTAVRVGREIGFERALHEHGPARAHMLDSVFSELLPEGVRPDALDAALTALGGDAFATERNAWVAGTYREFLAELDRRELYDPRSIHAMVAERIESDGLPAALRGAGRLHIYGLTNLRGRRRLFEALAAQPDVDVVVYVAADEEGSEWDELAQSVETVGEVIEGVATEVQPAPDAVREAAWVARRVKRLLAEGTAEPHNVAVVARSGRRDTRLVHRALEAAGVPSTARLRTVLAEIPALRILLELFRAEARGWDYGSLRHVLSSAYVGSGVDLRAIDHVSHDRRVEGLEQWAAALRQTRSLLDDEERARRLRREGLYADRIDKDMRRLEEFRARIAPLAVRRTEKAWIDLTLDILSGAWFDYRRRACAAVGDRWDIVRLDQRGIVQLEELLREWRRLVDSAAELDVADWHRRIRRLLEANELVFSTPLQAGVQVLEAHEAALTPFDHLFVVHANDGEFPRLAAGTGVFSDAERSALRGAGLPLSHRDESLRRERTLWRAVTAGSRVTISYRTTDANGVPRLPSLMVPEHDPGRELPRTLDVTARVEASGLKSELEPVSPAQHGRCEVQRLAHLRRGGDPAEFETPEPHLIRHAVLTAFSEELRDGALDDFVTRDSELVDGHSEIADPTEPGEAGSVRDPELILAPDRPFSERPNAWNGKIRDPLILEVLAHRFGPDYVWSASSMQSYARRPFDFLLERVLRLDEAKEADEETSPLAFGAVAHRLLEVFYARTKDDLPPALDEAAARLYEEIADEVLAGYERGGELWLGLPALWAVTREEVRDKVREYLAVELKYLADKDEHPIRVELAFGASDDEGGLLRLRGQDNRERSREFALRGRIDRVDRHGPGDDGWLRVIDYKSGTIPSPRGYDDGALLQTALYMKALNKLGNNNIEAGVFRSIKNKIQNGAMLKASDVDRVLGYAFAIPARVRAGLFEAVLARSVGEPAPWQLGPDVTRSESVLSSGSRFDIVAGEAPTPDDGSAEPADA